MFQNPWFDSTDEIFSPFPPKKERTWIEDALQQIYSNMKIIALFVSTVPFFSLLPSAALSTWVTPSLQR